MTADESGRVLMYKISFAEAVSEIASQVGDISTEESIQKLLPDPIGDGLLIISRNFAGLRTLQGELKRTPISLSGEDGDKIISLHPTKTRDFIVLGREGFSVYSWANGLEEQSLVYDTLGSVSLMISPPTPLMPSFPENREPASTTIATVPAWPMNYIAYLFPTSSGINSLQIWPAESFSAPASSSVPQPLPDPDHLGSKMRQIIAVWGSKLLFLDTNFWVCSLELSSQEIRAKTAKRHFFLLSEWQNGRGSKPFICEFSAVQREFFVVFKESLLVVTRGLDVAEPWGL